MRTMRPLALTTALTLLTSCQARPSPAPIEAVSVLNRPLFPIPPAAEKRREIEANLSAASLACRLAPHDEQAAIWHGRRLAYAGRFSEAVEAFTAGLADHPHSYRLLRHRGHRFITLRRFGDALRDLDRAAQLVQGVPDEVEPDGAPHAANQPRSTVQGNIFYHLALARYLTGDFAGAEAAWREALARATTDDSTVADLHWLYMSLRRQGLHAEARDLLADVSADMEIIENFGYHKLLLMYRGERSPESLLAELDPAAIEGQAIGYGLGNWLWCDGERNDALNIWRSMTASQAWPAFGFIAAEVELNREAQAHAER